MSDEAGAELLPAEVPDRELWNRLPQRYLGLAPDRLDHPDGATRHRLDQVPRRGV
jgi:hypothetical protein